MDANSIVVGLKCNINKIHDQLQPVIKLFLRNFDRTFRDKLKYKSQNTQKQLWTYILFEPCDICNLKPSLRRRNGHCLLKLCIFSYL